VFFSSAMSTLFSALSTFGRGLEKITDHMPSLLLEMPSCSQAWQAVRGGCVPDGQPDRAQTTVTVPQ
jgi:hypothetical protein